MESVYHGVKQSGKTILMKVTSRERPDQLLKTVSKYIELANNTKDMVWLFSFDQDDKTLNDKFLNDLVKLIAGNFNHEYAFYKWLTGDLSTFRIDNCVLRFDFSKGKIDAINRDIEILDISSFDKSETLKPFHWDILLNISDDQVPVMKGYDDIIRRTMPDDLDASLWFSDGIQPRINTQEIIGKAYYNRTGKIYHYGYLSFFCDNEATEVAQKLGKMIRSHQCIIKHEHYAAGFPERKDNLYTRNDKHWKHDEDLYKQRKSINFGL